jgi:hypothetical protein
LALLLLGPVLVPLQACTDLSENPPSAITPANFYRNEAEVVSSLAGIYAQLRSTLDDYYNISEISTDEMIVPTRGSDWYDGGQWLELHRQTWSAVSPVGNGFGNGAWVVAFTGISRANALLEALPGLTFASRDTIAAEVRTLRAFYYYLLMDLFGGVPIVTTTELKQRPRETRDSVFKFIEAELTAVRPTLPAEWPGAFNGRMTKGAADAILASMYLNAEVFTGTVTTGGLQRGPARWQDAINAADRILNSSVYQLADTFVQAFRSDNATSKENILVVKFLNRVDLGLNFVMRSLHYNQFGLERFRHAGGDVQCVRCGRRPPERHPGGTTGQCRNEPAGDGPRWCAAGLHDDDRRRDGRQRRRRRPTLQVADRSAARRTEQRQRLRLLPRGRDAIDQGRGAERAGKHGRGPDRGEQAARARLQSGSAAPDGCFPGQRACADPQRAAVRARLRSQAAPGFDPVRQVW